MLDTHLMAQFSVSRDSAMIVTKIQFIIKVLFY